MNTSINKWTSKVIYIYIYTYIYDFSISYSSPGIHTRGDLRSLTLFSMGAGRGCAVRQKMKSLKVLQIIIFGFVANMEMYPVPALPSIHSRDLILVQFPELWPIL